MNSSTAHPLRIVRLALVVAAFAASSSVACSKEDKAKSDGSSPPGSSASAAAVGATPSASAAPREGHAKVERVEIPEVRIQKNATTKVRASWSVPPGTGVNDEAPFKVRWSRSDGLAEPPNDVKATGRDAKDGFAIDVKPTPGTPNATLSGMIDVVVCDDETHSVCVPVRRAVELGFVVVDGAAAEANVAIPLPRAK